ncbi:glycosyltransferase family 2 protein [Candidatus Curtissbacteria bacterium]|nr:glycosyltransferase family 2 protein [Candidatus Curtissbacteria bacterium]
MVQTVSVVIPNYNGRAILEKNLPYVLSNCIDCEVIVVDDGSTDESVEFLKNNFKNVNLITQQKNHGFAYTVNNGVSHAKGDLVLLLNSDTAPRKGFLKYLKDHFINNPDLFAVGIADDSHESGKIIVKGRGGATFKKGFFQHYALPPTSGKTLWVSGGSGLYDRKKFLKLHGFDTVYRPFYWEDIDLSYRAQKRGFQCVFESKSKVDHYHEEGAIKKTRGEDYIQTISYKNQFIFVWKNITDPEYVLKHLLYLPIHLSSSLIKGDWAFVKGFFKAALQIPELIINYDQDSEQNNKSDRQILNEFQKK